MFVNVLDSLYILFTSRQKHVQNCLLLAVRMPRILTSTQLYLVVYNKKRNVHQKKKKKNRREKKRDTSSDLGDWIDSMCYQ